jgi:hypothetical protein
VRVISDLGGPGGVPPHRAGTVLVASVDVEWSKNYRITNGNRAFCYSIVWLRYAPGACWWTASENRPGPARSSRRR